MMKLRSSLMLGLLMLALAIPALAQEQQPAAPAGQWSLDMAVMNTAAQAWDYAGQNEQVYGDMMRTMAALSAANRGLTLPDNQQLGQMVGQIVLRETRADPDRLLYAIVDHAVTTSMGCLVPASVQILVPDAEPMTGWTLPDVVTSTVNQAWVISGQSRPEFMKMVNQIVALDLENRGWTLADTREMGEDFGELLRADLEAHPNDLLYTVVDRSLCQLMAKQTVQQ